MFILKPIDGHELNSIYVKSRRTQLKEFFNRLEYEYELEGVLNWKVFVNIFLICNSKTLSEYLSSNF